jgi:hypothetical protein
VERSLNRLCAQNPIKKLGRRLSLSKNWNDQRDSCIFDTRKTKIRAESLVSFGSFPSAFVLSNRDGPLQHQSSGFGGPMYAESPPLSDGYPENEVDASDLDTGRTPFHRVHQLIESISGRLSSFKNTPFPDDGLSLNQRILRALARFFVAVLIGVGVTLAWQYYGREIMGDLAPSWLLPASPPGPAVTSAELQAQLKPMALDLAIVTRSVDQLATIQDQLARKQDQLRQAFATLQAAEEDIDQKIFALAPAAPRVAHSLAKPPQPPAQ